MELPPLNIKLTMENQFLYQKLANNIDKIHPKNSIELQNITKTLLHQSLLQRQVISDLTKTIVGSNF